MKPTAVRKMQLAGKRAQTTLGRNGKSKRNYSSLIYRLLKRKGSGLCLSRASMVGGTVCCIAAEAARLSLYNKRRTITSQEIQTAVKLVRSAALTSPPECNKTESK